jgi:alpha-L-arabinofuranosidase
MNWLSAAYHARTMNTYLRHADRVSICTGADFFGTRWTVNAVKLPVPGGESYLLPIGVIMKLYKKHSGNKGVKISEFPEELDVAATRKGDKLFLHILNTQFSSPVKIDVNVDGYSVSSATIYEIAPGEKFAYVDDAHRDTFNPVEKQIQNPSEFIIQPASVNVIELHLKN